MALLSNWINNNTKYYRAKNHDITLYKYTSAEIFFLVYTIQYVTASNPIFFEKKKSKTNEN